MELAHVHGPERDGDGQALGDVVDGDGDGHEDGQDGDDEAEELDPARGEVQVREGDADGDALGEAVDREDAEDEHELPEVGLGVLAGVDVGP